MFIKINTKNKQKLAINKFFHLLPPVLLGFATLIFSITTLLFSQIKTFAAPGAPSGTPGILAFSVNNPTIDLHFTNSEIQSNTFKSDTAVLWCDAPNPTGFSVFLSSIDEDTSLKHSESSVTTQIPSITAPQFGSISTLQTWGYRIPNNAAEGWKPIPKNSNPDKIYTTNYGGAIKIGAEFGVKTSSNLTPGVYSKQVLFTAITNRVPTSATFIPGPNVNSAIRNANIGHDVEYFKKSNIAPANLATAMVVSTTDSDVPIYLWYDQAARTIFWWSAADTVYANEDSSLMLANLNDNATLVQLIDTRGIDTSRVKNMHHMFWTKDGLVKHINLDELDTSNVEDMGYMFSTPYENNLTTQIDPVDFSRFNTRRLKIMTGMFAGSHLPSIDIRNFNTSSVTNMEHLFNGLKKVTDLNLSGLNVREVNNIGSLFARNPGLISLNLSGWQLDSVHDMSYMFNQLHALNTLNLTGFTTKNVVDMNHMFNECHNLTALDLSSFDTRNVTDMNNMFRDNFALKNLNISSFNTSNVTNMAEMFRHSGVICPLDVSSFDTRKVTNMNGMFYWTLMSPENATLDISNFDTRSLTSALGMFNYTKAKTIYVSDQFTVNNLAPIPHEMFMSNINLVGGNGTQYAYPNNNSGFAHIDAPGNPGYFTRKP